jgi:hypothetical protein
VVSLFVAAPIFAAGTAVEEEETDAVEEELLPEAPTGESSEAATPDVQIAGIVHGEEGVQLFIVRICFLRTCVRVFSS